MFASPSTALPDAYVCVWLLSDVALPRARLVFGAASVVTVTVFEAAEMLPAASVAVTVKLYAVDGFSPLTVNVVAGDRRRPPRRPGAPGSR